MKTAKIYTATFADGAVKEFNGINELSTYFNVSEKTVQRWLKSEFPYDVKVIVSENKERLTGAGRTRNAYDNTNDKEIIAQVVKEYIKARYIDNYLFGGPYTFCTDAASTRIDYGDVYVKNYFNALLFTFFRTAGMIFTENTGIDYNDILINDGIVDNTKGLSIDDFNNAFFWKSNVIMKEFRDKFNECEVKAYDIMCNEGMLVSETDFLFRNNCMNGNTDIIKQINDKKTFKFIKIKQSIDTLIDSCNENSQLIEKVNRDNKDNNVKNVPFKDIFIAKCRIKYFTEQVGFSTGRQLYNAVQNDPSLLQNIRIKKGEAEFRTLSHLYNEFKHAYDYLKKNGIDPFKGYNTSSEIDIIAGSDTPVLIDNIKGVEEMRDILTEK